MVFNKWKALYEEAQEEIEELEESVEELEESIEELEEKVEELEKTVATQKEKTLQRSKTHDSLKEKLQVQEVLLTKTQEELQQSQTLIDTLNQRKLEQADILKKQQEELHQFHSANDSLKRELAEREKVHKKELFKLQNSVVLNKEKSRIFEAECLFKESEAKLTESLTGKSHKITELNFIVKDLQKQCATENGTDIMDLTTENAELKALVLEMKGKLEIADTFMEIHQIEQYQTEFGALFKMSELIDIVDEDSDFSALLKKKSNVSMDKLLGFLPQKVRANSEKSLEEQKQALDKKLVKQRKELLAKVNINLGLYDKFNDDTLENYFTLSKTVGGYSVDSFISFEEHETILIPETFRGEPIVTLQEKLFYNCKTIKNVVIEAPIITLPEKSFYGSSLKTVVLPDSIKWFSASKKIGTNGIFEGTPISEIVLPDKLKTIPSGTFRFCKVLKTVVLNQYLTRIDNSAFSSCTSLREIILPTSLTLIESHAFGWCTSLSKITLPDSITHLEYSAFDDCSSLNELTIPRSVKYIENSYKSSNRVIKCFPGSYAQQWAREHGFTIKNAEEDE